MINTNDVNAVSIAWPTCVIASGRGGEELQAARGVIASWPARTAVTSLPKPVQCTTLPLWSCPDSRPTGNAEQPLLGRDPRT